MNQTQRLLDLTSAIAGQIKGLKLTDVNLAGQITTINTALTNLNTQAAALINDAVASSTTVYSSDKVIQLNATLKAEILGGASEAFDTLKEIQTALTNDTTALGELLSAVNNRVRFDAEQVLTVAQKLTACTNIGIGDPDVDLVAAFNAALV